jgi:ubiquinone/menaquinone biosynthesis C-methylase UbiE
MNNRRGFFRKQIAATLRRAGLINTADWLKYLWVRMHNSSANKLFLRQHPGFPTPPPHLVYDSYNNVNWNEYLDAGGKVAHRIGQIVAQYLDRSPRDYLEWGCGPGAVIRHMPGILGGNVKMFGTDYNNETIAWCRQALKGITFSTNNLAPPLAFEASTFDCVCGLSVLTHLSEQLCKSWLAELGRVTKDGGLVILTTKGDSHEYRLSPAERQLLKNGRGVVRDQGVKEGKKLYDTILPKRFMESILPSTLEVVLYGADSMSIYQQDVWVLKKKPTSAQTH